MATDGTPTRHDALARATTLVSRARGLRRAQAEVQDLTAREVKVLARTAAQFFDTIPMVEFIPSLLPQSARGLRRIRHRVLHSVVEDSGSAGVCVRALLLGRDGALRLFTVRSDESRDLLQILEPGRIPPAGVKRDVVEWTPTLRVDGFRPFEILDKLAQSLDTVEAQIAIAEERVQVQKSALESGDLSVLRQTPDSASSAERRKVRDTPPPSEPAAASVPAKQPEVDLFAQVEALANATQVVPVGGTRSIIVSGARSELDSAAEEWGDADESEPHWSEKSA